ncbi:MAG: UDP-glucose 4-epimerase GalE [Clostridiales bacterium]|nr:UDP-glucose 4-epimerase GalE [Clostridiales bacterium]
MAILITGGAGYIGTHTCIELLNAGEDIVVIDNFSNSKPRAVELVKEITGREFPFYEVDVTDEKALDVVFTENKIESVIHFAGLKAVGESVQKPIAYYHNNIVSTLVLCEIMAKHDVFRIVFSSSATVYGSPKEVPIKEDFPLSTTNPYGSTKLMIEQILCDLYISDDRWSIALLRYFNPIGAHKSGKIGEDPNGIPNNLLPFISQVAVGKLDYLRVFGDDFDTVDGTGVRDYIHVTDLALGHVKALDKIATSNGVATYNLGTGNGYSVLEIVRAFEKASGVEIPYKIIGRRQGDIAECYADATKAKNELGWEAIHGLDEMCEDLWRFAKNNPNGL